MLPTGELSTVQLFGGQSSRDGYVLVYYESQWGTICDDGWSVNDAAVVCRMLGYTLLSITIYYYAVNYSLLLTSFRVRCGS